MKVKEILEKMDDFTDEERQKWLGKLMGMLSQLSVATIRNFQEDWINSDKAKNIQRPFDEFTKAQNNAIRDCIKIETSRLGLMVRSTIGLPPLDLELELIDETLN